MWIWKKLSDKIVITQYARSLRRNACNEESKKRICLTRAGILADLKVGRANSFFHFFPSPRGLLNQRLALFLIAAVCTVIDSSLVRYPIVKFRESVYALRDFFRRRIADLPVQNRRKVGRNASEVSTVGQLQRLSVTGQYLSGVYLQLIRPWRNPFFFFRFFGLSNANTPWFAQWKISTPIKRTRDYRAVESLCMFRAKRIFRNWDI